MKEVLSKIMALFMAFVVLFTTMSFTIDMHYCGDTLMDVAIFHKAKTCAMEGQNTNANSNCSNINKNCCTEKQIKVKGQDELKLTFDKLTLDQQVFVASFIYTYINLFEGTANNVTSYEAYRPPLVIKQIYKLDETYLI